MGEKRVQGKVAVVTGGGSGICKGAALRLAEQGAKLCLLDIDWKEANKVKEEMKKSGGEAIVVETDVSKPEMVEQGIRSAVEHFGRLDIVFANAGLNATWAPIEDLEVEDWDKTIHTNLKG